MKYFIFLLFFALFHIGGTLEAESNYKITSKEEYSQLLKKLCFQYCLPSLRLEDLCHNFCKFVDSLALSHYERFQSQNPTDKYLEYSMQELVRHIFQTDEVDQSEILRYYIERLEFWTNYHTLHDEL
eukprot:TRINITY_DN17418_c0_g1_i1.p1 TRINITY_DN17418_c0_g1~~TRINITY_DN17418_c0_g1_i1.p1  ORF type:complete len:127 (-),score=2.30 TRINITY_DN17418_c0_g1_i1:45-425(-)